MWTSVTECPRLGHKQSVIGLTQMSDTIKSLYTRKSNLMLTIRNACVVSHGWIVTYPSSTTSYSFDVTDHPTLPKKFLATDPHVVPCESCSRFTQADAISVAESCSDPSNFQMVARPYIDVCIQALNEVEQTITLFESMAS